jgi:hypothetical protein
MRMHNIHSIICSSTSHDEATNNVQTFLYLQIYVGLPSPALRQSDQIN